MARSGKAALGFGLLLIWGFGVWLVFRSVVPTPEEKYADWLAARLRGGVAVSRVEMWVNRFGIAYFANARRERDLRFTMELMEHADYSVAVASWMDSTRGITARFQPTWPHVRKSLEEMTGGNDPARLEAAFSRADVAGFATWDRTIARSARMSGALDELALIVRALRDFEQAHQPGSHRMESLQRLSELYALTPADFARALVEETDPAAEALLNLVMGDLGGTPGHAYGALLSEWKTGGFPEADWGMPASILEDARVGSFRIGVFTWLALGKESEQWRKHHCAMIGDLLEEFMRAEPDFARQCATGLVREITKDGADLASDWKFVTGILLSKIDPEPDLESWIGNEVGSGFAWLCHLVNAEGMLNRALEIWGDKVPHRPYWIGHFIDSGHYAAACALIEGSKGDLHLIRSHKETYQEEKAKKLDEYLALSERIGEHSNEPQVKGLIRLDLGIAAMRNLNGTPEGDAAKREVLAAIEMLNEAETFNPYLLEQTVALVLDLDEAYFTAARPCFDKWRGPVTPGIVVDRVVRGDFDRGERGYQIWRTYFSKFVSLSEIPSMELTLAGLIRATPGDKDAVEKLERLANFANSGSGGFKVPGLGSVNWLANRMIAGNEWARSADWMFDRMMDFRSIDPELDHVGIIHQMSGTASSELYNRPPQERIRWLGAILSHEGSESFAWPEPFYEHIYRSEGENPVEVIHAIGECFENHPLRRWIARDLIIEGGYASQDGTDRREILISMANRPWLKNVIAESFDKVVDLDAFEKDFENASPGARRFFLKHPVVQRSTKRLPRHPSGREFTKEDLARFLVWEAGVVIEIAERRESFALHDFIKSFTDLIAEAETRPDDPVIRSLLERLQRISFEPPWHRFGDYELKSLRELQARSLPYSKGISETHNLLTNSSLPATERVWKLALKGEFEAAGNLMEAHADELEYWIPTGMKRSDLASPALAQFLEKFPEGDELGIYASVFLSELRDFLPFYISPRNANILWPYSQEQITNYEDDLRELVLPFEAAIFSNKELERKTTVMLGGLFGAPALMPEKLASLRGAVTSNYPQEILSLLEFDASLTKGDCRDIKRHLAELSKSGRWESTGRPAHAFEVLEFHLWRRALLGLEITEEQRSAIQELCFSTLPFRELAPSGLDILRFHQMVRQGSRMYPLHLALEMIERVPNKLGCWTWSDFDGLALDRYRDSKGFHANLSGGAIAILARRCQDWDEEARWSLIGVFEDPLPGSSRRPQVVRGLAMFNVCGFLKEEEVVRRAREFVSRYPAYGWNYHTIWRLGRQYGDETLAAFGRTGAEPYFGKDPNLQKAFDTDASKLSVP